VSGTPNGFQNQKAQKKGVWQFRFKVPSNSFLKQSEMGSIIIPALSKTSKLAEKRKDAVDKLAKKLYGFPRKKPARLQIMYQTVKQFINIKQLLMDIIRACCRI
jgi:hypothetical protein